MKQHQMSTACDVLSEAGLRAALGGAAAEVSLAVLSRCGSTNDEAKRLAVEGVSRPTLIVANEQTAGRGRLGRSFYSPAQTGLYCSVLYPTSVPLYDAVSVTGAAAVAVMRAIRDLTGRQTGIKWVNDLFLDGKKVCGILTEALSGIGTQGENALIIGIGVNLTTASFPEELALTAGAVRADGIERAALVAAIWRELSPFLRDPADRSWLADYRAHSTVLGRSIEWIRGEERQTGIATDITEDGALAVRLPSGEEQLLRTGEISVRLQ